MANFDFTTPVRIRDVAGIRRRHVFNYIGPVSYTTGGDPFTPADAALGNVEAVDAEIAWDGANTIRLLVVDEVNQKILWFVPNTGNEVAAATNLSGFTSRVEIFGD